jgi:hypothetical protein
MSISAVGVTESLFPRLQRHRVLPPDLRDAMLAQFFWPAHFRFGATLIGCGRAA